jgi:hypothetical protein
MRIEWNPQTDCARVGVQADRALFASRSFWNASKMASAPDSVVPPMTDDQLQGVYTWLDSIPLSRPKRNCTRDFSDGGECSCARGSCIRFGDVGPPAVLLAEVIHHYFPKLVQLHNYSAANSIKQKMYNWSTLNRECLGPCRGCHPTRLVMSCRKGVQEDEVRDVQG